METETNNVTMLFGILDGPARPCWECREVTGKLAWYTSAEGINIVCRSCIKKIFEEVGLDWEQLKPDGY